ncbi:deoxyuridine 5'-triphosphate nucleotidohydrolase family protein [Dorcoceras hygrometricum]|uniref:dUTP diphosphatase n=1 Tax=Dorcoceras hygrometricum TaxID=472368 RepID=A0A2Z7CP76_9LAMI|nr:deoxyuridine 5'-triphosphate nucleotidohydrolase family protein [Dorcoceras hygrometricum]
MIPTDLSIAIPEGTYARIAPRSGLTWKSSIDVGADIGDRIAQLIIEKIMTPEVDDLDSTVRAFGGFGSTGI